MIRPDIVSCLGPRNAPLGVICVALCLAGGCADSLQTHPAKGKVLYKNGGTLPAGGTVIFESTVAPHPRASGSIGPDGSFELATLDVGPGAVAGEHRVRVEPEVPDGVDLSQGYEAARGKIIHPKYLQFETSGLKYTVAAGENANVFVIEVERPVAR